MATDGRLDLRSWAPERDRPAELSGLWQFYPGELLSPEQLAAADAPPPAGTLQVPGTWNEEFEGGAGMSSFGHGTYRLTVALPPHDVPLGIRFRSFGTAFTLWADGVFVGSAGEVGVDRASSGPEWRPFVASLPPLREEVDLVMQVSNYHHRRGGAIGKLQLGPVATLERARQRAVAFEMFLAGAILIIGLYHLCLFAFRPSNRAPLYFGLTCLLLSCYTLLSGERYFGELFPWIGWHGRVRLTNLTSFLAVPAFLAFIATLYPRELGGVLLRALQGTVLALAAVVLVTPSHIYSFVIPAYHVLTLLACVLLVVTLVRAAVARQDGAVTILGGFLLFFAAVVNDVLFDQGLIDTGQFTGLGLFVLLGFQAFVIARRFSFAFETVETQRADLERANVAQTLEIDRRVEAQRALAESEANYRTLIENVPNIIFTMDLRGCFTSLNEFGLELLGYRADELIGRPLLQLVHPDDRERMSRILERAIEMGRSSTQQGVRFRLQDRRGDILWVSSSATARFTDVGEFIHFLGAIRNVTQERELEAQLIQAQRMEAIGTLAGGIAHDFNNLLTGVLGNASLMRTSIPEGHPALKRIELIERSVEDATQLTRQLLGLARGGKYLVKPTDISRVARRTVHLFGSTHRQVVIREEYADGLWTTQVDRSQLDQSLLNLLVNAAQAMSGGGHLTVETANVTVDSEQASAHEVEPGRYVLLAVTDDGPGMDEETRRRCFDPFFTTKEVGRGTGLGLATVYGIVRNHLGFVDVVTAPGKGCSFRIFLPAGDHPHEEDDESSGGYARGSETILLVDDEPAVLDVAAEMLRSMGYEVLECSSGAEAIELFRQSRGRIDAVVLDMVMPDLGGGRTFDALRKLDPTVRVLLSSGYSVNGEARQILDRGCDGFIQKPFDMERLSNALQRLLGAKR